MISLQRTYTSTCFWLLGGAQKGRGPRITPPKTFFRKFGLRCCASCGPSLGERRLGGSSGSETHALRLFILDVSPAFCVLALCAPRLNMCIVWPYAITPDLLNDMTPLRVPRFLSASPCICSILYISRLNMRNMHKVWPPSTNSDPEPP